VSTRLKRTSRDIHISSPSRFAVRNVVFGLFLAIGSSGCVERADEVRTESVRDTIDGMEHVIGFAAGAWVEEGDPWRVDPGRSIDIGELDGPEAYVFGQISGAVLDRYGRLHVADPQALEIRVFSLEGESLQTVGRRGEGPGEFRHISGLALAPEGVAALDGSLNRVTIFNSSGDPTRTFRLRRSYSLFEDNAPMRFDVEGRFFDRARLSRTAGVDSIGVWVYQASGDDVTTALLAVVEADRVTVEQNGSPFMEIPRPFSPQPAIAFSPDGRIYLARGDEYRIEVFSPDGDLTRVLRRPVEATRVTDHERDSVFTVIAEAFRDMGAALPRGTRFPEWKPVIEDLVVDSNAYLWVLNGRGMEPVIWSVHDPDGLYLGDVELPQMMVTQITHEFVVGAVSDELGVRRVRLLPILK